MARRSQIRILSRNALRPDGTDARKVAGRAHDPAATSASFVIDRRGRVAHVHPGPEFYPTDDPSRARQDRDFRALRAAIRRAVDHE